jgi:hypothetical protein
MNPQIHLPINTRDEPPSLKDLSKSKIYKQLAEEYYLPDKSCRAISRDYLVGVHTNKYFKVKLSDFKKFTADLTPRLMERTTHTTNQEMVEKLEALLKEYKHSPLGFKVGLLPDSEWLSLVARLIDPCNAADLFKLPVCKPEEGKEIDSNRVLMAKKAAEKKMLGDNGLLGKREVIVEVRELWESQKRLKSREQELETLKNRGRKLEEKVEKDKQEVEMKLIKTTETVLGRLKRGEESLVQEEMEMKRQRVREV